MTTVKLNPKLSDRDKVTILNIMRSLTSVASIYTHTRNQDLWTRNENRWNQAYNLLRGRQIFSTNL